MARANPRVLPGYRLSLSFALLYLSVLVLIPLGACVVTAAGLSWEQFRAAVWTERARAAYALTFGAAFVAAVISSVLGLLIAWVLVRYEFPGKRFFDSLVDLPFALPTAVAGLVFSNLYVANGWLGQFLVPLGIEAAYSRLAIVLVLVFIGFPFVVRTVQPVLESLDAEAEEAAALLGARRWQTFRRVIFPALLPGLVTGLRTGVRPRPGRVRLGRVRLGQHAVQDRDRGVADRQPARRGAAEFLPRGDRDRHGAAGRVVPDAGRDQPARSQIPKVERLSAMGPVRNQSPPRPRSGHPARERPRCGSASRSRRSPSSS